MLQMGDDIAVSYTHLDVYKRQVIKTFSASEITNYDSKNHYIELSVPISNPNDKDSKTVSYTHLDVYKRQVICISAMRSLFF